MKVGIIVIAIIGVVLAGIFVYKQPTEPEEPLWPSSGPFAINKQEYKIGEKIFMSIYGLQTEDIGVILWQSPEGKIANKQRFNGTAKSAFNTYFEPDTSRFSGLYDVDQLVGVWTLNFTGTNYPPLHFTVINEFILGSEKNIHDIDRPNQTG